MPASARAVAARAGGRGPPKLRFRRHLLHHPERPAGGAAATGRRRPESPLQAGGGERHPRLPAVSHDASGIAVGATTKIAAMRACKGDEGPKWNPNAFETSGNARPRVAGKSSTHRKMHKTTNFLHHPRTRWRAAAPRPARSWMPVGTYRTQRHESRRAIDEQQHALSERNRARDYQQATEHRLAPAAPRPARSCMTCRQAAAQLPTRSRTPAGTNRYAATYRL